jgi:transcriptional regulator with XRE-family HTH domain
METNCAKFIKEARHALGMTQEKFAQLIGVKRYNLARYETGAVIPPGNVILEVISKRRESQPLSN